MPNTASMDPEIAELRASSVRHERELGTLLKGQADLEGDVNQIGDEARKTRHDLRNQIAAAEGRMVTHTDERFTQLEARLDRMITTGRWVIGLSVPAVCTLLGVLIGRT